MFCSDACYLILPSAFIFADLLLVTIQLDLLTIDQTLTFLVQCALLPQLGTDECIASYTEDTLSILILKDV